MRIFRESLTAIATLLVLGLFAVLIAPRFIDWNPYRSQITELISRQAGVPVAISGDLRVSILPVPEIDAEGLVIGEEDTPAFTADRLTASLSLTALISGAIHITEARADRVRLSLDALPKLIGKQGAAPVRGSGIDRLDIRSATVISRDEAIASGLDIVLEAPDLAGPLRLDILNPAQSRDFRAQFGRFTDGQARVKGLVEDKKLGMRATLDGLVSLPDGSGRALFDGQALFNGNPFPAGPDGPQVPFDGSARLLLVAGQAIADPLNVAIGLGENATQLAGQVHIDAQTGRPKLTATLGTKRVDVAGLAAMMPAERSSARASGNPLPALQRMILPFNLSLALDIGAMPLPDGTITDVTMELAGDERGLRVGTLKAKIPGASRIAYIRAANAGSALIDGRIELEATDPAALALWLRGGEPAGRMPSSLRASTGITGNGESFDLPGIFIASEAGALSGSGRLENLKPGERARLALELKAGRFDARVLGALDPLRGQGGLELSTKLEISSLVLDGNVVGGLSVDLEREGNRSSLRQLQLKGPSGEQLTLSGAVAPEVTQLTAKLDAERLDALARMLAALMPGPASDALIARAPQLAPALAVANIRIEPRGGDATWDVIADGRFGGSLVKLRSQSHTSGEAMRVSLEGEAQNEDGARLLGQFSGVAIAGGPSLPGKLKLKAEGNPRRALALTLGGAIAGMEIEMEGTLNPFRPTRPLEGRLRFSSGDFSVFHKAMGGGAPQVQQATRARFDGRFFFEGPKITLTAFQSEFGPSRVAGEVSFDFARGGQVAGQLKMGELALATLLGPISGLPSEAMTQAQFPTAPLASALPPTFAGDLWIEAERLLVGGASLRNPQFVLRFAPGLVAIEGLEALHGETRDSEARYGATLTLSRKGKALEAAGRLAIQNARFTEGPGRFSGEIPFSASGETAQDLLASLGGAGQLTVRGLVLPEADLAALGRIATRPLDALLPIEENRIGGLVDQELRRASLSLPDMTLPVTVINGQLRLGGVAIDGRSMQSPNTQLAPQFTLDLPRRHLDFRLGVRLRDAPPGWRGAPPEIAFGWTGRIGEANPLAGIRRQVMVSPLVNGLLAIQLQRDLEQAEAFEADVRERASLLRRQRGDQFTARRRQEIEAFERADADARERASIIRRQRADQFQLRRRTEIEAFEKAEAERKARLELEALLRRQAEEARARALETPPSTETKTQD